VRWGTRLGEDQQRAAVVRGERLDADAPGFGLGLSIVSELAELYGGELRLARSSLGGLSAEIELPAADGGRWSK
jgi:signal transduction histidine kinase